MLRRWRLVRLDVSNTIMALLGQYATIRLFCVDPGATYSMLAMVDELGLDKARLQFYSEGWASAQQLVPAVPLTPQAIADFDKQDILIIGSQTNYVRTQEVIQATKQHGIPVVFIFDHWKNYLDHFYNESNNKVTLPEYILFPDAICQQGFEQSFKRCKIPIPDYQGIISHHFAIDKQVADIQSINIDKTNKLKQSYDAVDTRIYLILLEPEETAIDLGYTLISNCQVMFGELKKITGLQKVLIKPHPRQDVIALRNVLDACWDQCLLPYHLCAAEDKVADLIAIADEVWGITTVGLIIAKKLGKPIRSFQVGRNERGILQSNSYIEPFVTCS